MARGYLAALLLAGCLYVTTVAPGSLWQDSGMAQIRTLQRDLYGRLGLALAHPLYYICTIAFQHLPLSESAYKTNLVSAVFGAVTVANVLLLIRLITGRWAGAIIGAVSLAVAHTFWQHCALAEVYTVTTALLTAELLCVYQYVHTRRTVWLFLLFLANGLGISNHMLASLSLLCDVGLLTYLLLRREVKPVLLPVFTLCWVAGASLYLYLIATEIARGMRPADAIRSALFGHFARNVLNVLPSRNLLLDSVGYVGLNFPTPALLLVFMARRYRSSRSQSIGSAVSSEPEHSAAQRNASTLFRAYLVAVTLLYLLWAVRYDVPDQYTFFIPFIVLAGIWIGLGADGFLDVYGPQWFPILVIAAILPAGVYLPLPDIAERLHLSLGLKRQVPYRNEYEYFLHPWKTGYRNARVFAEAIRKTLPQNAVLLADDTTLPPLQYLQLMGGWSTNARVLPLAAASLKLGQDSNETLETVARERRLFVMSNITPYCPDWVLKRYRLVPDGPIYHVVPFESATKAN